MVDNDGPAPTSRRRHIARLAVFAGFLAGMFYLVAVARVIDIDRCDVWSRRPGRRPR